MGEKEKERAGKEREGKERKRKGKEMEKERKGNERKRKGKEKDGQTQLSDDMLAYFLLEHSCLSKKKEALVKTHALYLIRKCLSFPFPFLSFSF